MTNRIILCDCHLAPMQRDTCICLSAGKEIVAWACDCGRYYCGSEGYFYLHRAKAPINTETSCQTPCRNGDCIPDGFMALVQHGDWNRSGTVWWYCLECKAEFGASGITSAPSALRANTPHSALKSEGWLDTLLVTTSHLYDIDQTVGAFGLPLQTTLRRSWRVLLVFQ
jgi:hypothetical protein